MANISNIIRRFNRFELKYLLPLKQAEAFREAIAYYLEADAHGDERGNYAISSLYYDSPDYHFYWEKMEGIKFRRKLRIRHYESAGTLEDDSPVFVEIKQRLDRVTQKRRVVLPYRDALKLCNERTLPDEYKPQDEPVLSEIQTMTWHYNLRPTSIVSYMRQAYIGSDYDVGLRVTFDTNLRYRAADLQLDSKGIESRRRRPIFHPTNPHRYGNQSQRTCALLAHRTGWRTQPTAHSREQILPKPRSRRPRSAITIHDHVTPISLLHP